MSSGSVSLKQWFQQASSSSASSSSYSPSSSSSPRVLILDGGVSTHLKQMVANRRNKLYTDKIWEHKELWSSSLLLSEEGRTAIVDGHVDFLTVGNCDIVSSVTYQCYYTPLVGKEDRPFHMDDNVVDEMLRNGIRLARQAIEKVTLNQDEATEKREQNSPRRRYVAASIGSYGGALADGSEYTGNYGTIKKDGLMTFHRRKVETLVNEGPDALAFETIPSHEEFRAILLLLKELQLQELDVAVWMSLACQSGSQLNDGISVETVLETLHELDSDAQLCHAIGINCCSINHVASLVPLLRTGNRPIVVYPNSGEEYDVTNRRWKPGTGITVPSLFAEAMHQVLGKTPDGTPTRWTTVVGGCCRTTPETIAALRSAFVEDTTAATTTAAASDETPERKENAK